MRCYRGDVAPTYLLLHVPLQGASSLIMPIPDGPGYPRVNGITADGATFWFMDFAFVYTIDIASGNVTSKNGFTAAPRVVGFPVWIN